MRRIEIKLSEQQYQHIIAERRYGNRINLQEETFGGYEICLHVSSPDIIPATPKMKMINKIELGEVVWKIR
ncbi:hypothetical protein [uncultured Christiangramia sp.]|uniref:hypothetical protein n=1 Tax=uncultured Christiangramia sp. TaxID=503836 RepID=UPI0026145985|nr:hypothetical protein [uncultured Christiangramia sp.]